MVKEGEVKKTFLLRNGTENTFEPMEPPRTEKVKSIKKF